MKHYSRCVLVLLAAALGSHAAVGQVVFDGSLPGTTAGTLAPVDNTLTIEQSRGFVNGSNLFQSFQQFNVGQGETAVFQSTDSIRHILARVTGDMPTTIDGTLRVANPAITAFWLLNPSGILVTENAVIDIPGAVALGAADNIVFSSGTWGANPLNGADASTLSADPQSFGFLPGSAAQGVVIRGQPFATGSDRLPTPSYIGYTLGNQPPVTSTSWMVAGQQVSFTSPGDLTLTNGLIYTWSEVPGSGAIEIAAGGDARIEGSMIVTVGDAERSGDIDIRGRNIVINERSLVALQSRTGKGSGALSVSGESLLFENAFIRTRAQNGGTAGSIDFNLTGAMQVLNGGNLFSSVSNAEYGEPVRIRAGAVIIDGKVEVVSAATGNLVVWQSRIATSNFSDAETSKAADILIDTPSLSISGDPNTGIDSYTSSGGHAGNIVINAQDVIVADGTVSSEGHEGAAGTVTVRLGYGGSLRLVRDGWISTHVDSGSGGDVSIELDHGVLEMNHSMIRTTVVDGLGDGGNVRIDANGSEINLIDATIATSTLNSGSGGDITVTGAGVTLMRNSQIVARAEGTGNGGDISIDLVSGAVLVPDAVSLISAQARVGVNGSVAIDSPNTDLNAAMQPQDVDVSRPAALASNACARGVEARSTLVREGKGGLASRPDDYLAAAGTERGEDVTGSRVAKPAGSLGSLPLVAATAAKAVECF